MGNVKEMFEFAGFFDLVSLFMNFDFDLKIWATRIGSSSSSSLAAAAADADTVLHPCYVILSVFCALDGFQSFLLFFYVILELNWDTIRLHTKKNK